MLVVGLTGGIGTGKSTVAAALAGRGAAVVDADGIARQVVEPGGAAYRGVVDRFGPGVVGPDGRLDRPALARIVFSDASARRDLEAMTHPAIWAVIARRLAELGGTDAVVVVDLPLLDESSRARFGLDVVVVVDAPVEVAVERLVAHRGFSEADARARIAAQVPRGQRLSLADLVVDNSADPGALILEIDRLWQALQALRPGQDVTPPR